MRISFGHYKHDGHRIASFGWGRDQSARRDFAFYNIGAAARQVRRQAYAAATVLVWRAAAPASSRLRDFSLAKPDLLPLHEF